MRSLLITLAACFLTLAFAGSASACPVGTQFALNSCGTPVLVASRGRTVFVNRGFVPRGGYGAGFGGRRVGFPFRGVPVIHRHR